MEVSLSVSALPRRTSLEVTLTGCPYHGRVALYHNVQIEVLEISRARDRQQDLAARYIHRVSKTVMRRCMSLLLPSSRWQTVAVTRWCWARVVPLEVLLGIRRVARTQRGNMPRPTDRDRHLGTQSLVTTAGSSPYYLHSRVLVKSCWCPMPVHRAGITNVLSVPWYRQRSEHD